MEIRTVDNSFQHGGGTGVGTVPVQIIGLSHNNLQALL